MKPIVEDRPLETWPFGISSGYFGGHFGEPIVVDRPLETRPFGIPFDCFVGHFEEEDHFVKLIVEEWPLGTGPLFKDFEYFGGTLGS